MYLVTLCVPSDLEMSFIFHALLLFGCHLLLCSVFYFVQFKFLFFLGGGGGKVRAVLPRLPRPADPGGGGAGTDGQATAGLRRKVGSFLRYIFFSLKNLKKKKSLKSCEHEVRSCFSR